MGCFSSKNGNQEQKELSSEQQQMIKEDTQSSVQQKIRTVFHVSGQNTIIVKSQANQFIKSHFLPLEEISNRQELSGNDLVAVYLKNFSQEDQRIEIEKQFNIFRDGKLQEEAMVEFKTLQILLQISQSTTEVGFLLISKFKMDNAFLFLKSLELNLKTNKFTIQQVNFQLNVFLISSCFLLNISSKKIRTYKQQ